ncbi:MAG: hypothetical protein J2P28_14200 [Actinobacteria bacterium]|nr:hypothetical protein [Actinomycetota bacterium]MBO0836643.1 hypothetical protein [Actinomycetota bacterium]
MTTMPGQRGIARVVSTAIHTALGSEVTQVPSHAGRLRPLERGVFAMVFTLMASVVVFVAFLANTAIGHQLLTGPSIGAHMVPYGLRPAQAGLAQFRQSSRPSHPHRAHTAQLSAGPDVQLNDAELAAALQPVIASDPGRLAVGVIDVTSGASATYNSGTQLRTGGLVTADILAVLLLRHQQSATPVSAHEAELADAMMQDGSATAAAALWTIIGQARGLAAGNATLKLRDTTMAISSFGWKWTKTTVADQLQLLVDLTGAQSPLTPASRDYAIGLMTRDAAAQTWDVLAAANPGAPGATADGSIYGPRWVLGSIGLILRNGHELLIAVLSDLNPAEKTTIDAVRSAALAAAGLVN